MTQTRQLSQPATESLPPLTGKPGSASRERQVGSRARIGLRRLALGPQEQGLRVGAIPHRVSGNTPHGRAGSFSCRPTADAAQAGFAVGADNRPFWRPFWQPYWGLPAGPTDLVEWAVSGCFLKTGAAMGRTAPPSGCQLARTQGAKSRAVPWGLRIGWPLGGLAVPGWISPGERPGQEPGRADQAGPGADRTPRSSDAQGHR